MAERVTVGAIAGAFGVKGEVRLKSFCAEPAAIADYTPLFTKDGTTIDSVRITGRVKNGFSARLSGVATREAAEALRGITLLADRDRLPGLPDDEFYHADLIGLEVVDPGGERLGKVTSVLNHGASDLLEIKGPGIASGVLLPFTRDNVPTVDLAARRIVADPPPGLWPEAKGDGD